jgi:aminomethyltransferase
LAASSYSLVPDFEYYAIRHSAGLLDVSPLYKYKIGGRDALRLLNKVVTRDMKKCSPGQIFYTPWCDERGKTVDDGTVWNMGDGTYRMTAAEPNLAWLYESATGMDVEIEDVSDDIAAVALQGPSSRAILNSAAEGAAEKLRYYRFTQARIDGVPVEISRTGYTGDLGYEVWCAREDAERLWDAITEHGRPHKIKPAGMDALDVARIEAGLILADVDYMPTRKALIDSQRYSPFELSLDWTVSLEKGPFVGRRALQGEAQVGPPRRTVGLEVDWKEAEKLYLKLGLPPAPPHGPSREPIPIYSGTRQVGKATSSVWSPTLKEYIAIATAETAYSKLGTVLDFEITIEGQRKKAPCTVVQRPFYEPPWKKA